MDNNVLLISADPTFIFMVTTIIDQLDLELLPVQEKNFRWENIEEKKPRIIIWDFEDSAKVSELEEKIHTYLPQECHIILFSNAISGLSHFNNGRLHLFQKPFSPSEISNLLKDICS
jgi:hypothetical protein